MLGIALPTCFTIPAALDRRMDVSARALLQADGLSPFDFSRPFGEEALVSPDSVSWRVFRNPISLFIGGVTAVILELAEPGVRSGVWEHSAFRRSPVRRLRRTGHAAMVTVYGPRSAAETMIAGIVRMHDKVSGVTPAGIPYRANDPDLLRWVQATAVFGFGVAYSEYVRPLAPAEFDRLYREGQASARLYGAMGAPASEAEWAALLDAMQPRLEPSPIVFEFLDIMRRAPAFPAPLRPMQRMLVRAAVEITPEWVRWRLGLPPSWRLRPWERPLVRRIAGFSDTIMLRSSPAVQSCLRLGLPADYLFRA